MDGVVFKTILSEAPKLVLSFASFSRSIFQLNLFSFNDILENFRS